MEIRICLTDNYPARLSNNNAILFSIFRKSLDEYSNHGHLFRNNWDDIQLHHAENRDILLCNIQKSIIIHALMKNSKK